jgi:hypothetical protein
MGWFGLMASAWGSPGVEERDLLAGAPAPLAEALRAFSQERDRWAYTEHFTSRDRKGATKETRVIRFDPSLAPEDRWALLEEDGRVADERAQRKFRRQMTKDGDKRIKLSEYLQLDRATVVRESPGETVYEVPLRKENNDRLPPDKFQVLVTLSRSPARLAAIDVVLREPMRMALVAKVRSGGASIRFARASEEHGPVVHAVSGQGEATVLLVRVGGSFRAERSEFKRVTPFDERFRVKMGNLDYLDF